MAAALEGALAGRGVGQRFAELTLPPYSPPFGLWVIIGLGYYVLMGIVLHRLLGAGLASPAQTAAFVLVLVILLANAAWNCLFFRHKALAATFRATVAYAVLVVILEGVLVTVDKGAAAVLVPYLVYLVYVLWWSYFVWRLNAGVQPVT